MKITIRSLLFLSKVKADCQRYVGGAQGSFLNTSVTNSDGEEETLTLYKTGDFAKIVDGRLYYEGRLDAQVSVCGNFRLALVLITLKYILSLTTSR